MKAVESQLIDLLGQVDATFQPIRSWQDQSNVAAILERRLDFHRRGLPVPRTSGSTESRKQSERLFDQIERSGAVVFRRTNGRRTHWRLSDATDWRLRYRCGQAGFDSALVVLLAVDELTRRGHTNAGYVPDWSIALRPGDAGQSERARLAVAFVAELAAPALCRGWLRGWSDVDGAVGFKLSNEGRQAIGQAIEKVERENAKAAQKAGGVAGGKKAGKGRPLDRVRETFPMPKQNEPARTTAQAAKAAGMERRTYEKAKADQGGETCPTLKPRAETARTTAQAAEAAGMKRRTYEKAKTVIESGNAEFVAMPDYSVAAHDRYFEALDELKTAKPKRENAVPIPLSAGDWPSAATRKNIPAIFDQQGNVRTPAAWMRAFARNTKAKK